MSDEYLEQFLLDKHRTMHADFSRVFARERVGGFEKRHQHLIEQLAMVHYMAIICLMRDHLIRIESLAILRKQLIDNGNGLRTRNTHYSNGAHAMWCGDGADGIVIKNPI